MPKKLETTPDGIRCHVCGEDKPRYHFFSPRGRYNKEFFANGVPDGHTCWDCGGDYKCLGCGEVKPAHQFRIQGRYCADCLKDGNLTPAKNTPVGSDSPSNSIEGLSS